MTVINKSNREQMVSVLVKRAFDVKEKAAKNELNKCFEEIHAAYHGPENMKLMRMLPEQYFIHKIAISFGFNNFRAEGDSSLPCAYKFATNGYWTKKELLEITSQDYVDLIDKRAAAIDLISDEKKSFESEMDAVISTARTFKKLWQIWPECHEILGKFEPSTDKPMLPALQTDRLNKMLDIPKEAV